MQSRYGTPEKRAELIRRINGLRDAENIFEERIQKTIQMLQDVHSVLSSTKKKKKIAARSEPKEQLEKHIANYQKLLETHWLMPAPLNAQSSDEEIHAALLIFYNAFNPDKLPGSRLQKKTEALEHCAAEQLALNTLLRTLPGKKAEKALEAGKSKYDTHHLSIFDFIVLPTQRAAVYQVCIKDLAEILPAGDDKNMMTTTLAATKQLGEKVNAAAPVNMASLAKKVVVIDDALNIPEPQGKTAPKKTNVPAQQQSVASEYASLPSAETLQALKEAEAQTPKRTTPNTSNYQSIPIPTPGYGKPPTAKVANTSTTKPNSAKIPESNYGSLPSMQDSATRRPVRHTAPNNTNYASAAGLFAGKPPPPAPPPKQADAKKATGTLPPPPLPQKAANKPVEKPNTLFATQPATPQDMQKQIDTLQEFILKLHAVNVSLYTALNIKPPESMKQENEFCKQLELERAKRNKGNVPNK